MQKAALLALPAFCHAASKGVSKLVHSALGAVGKAASSQAASPAVKLLAAQALRQLCLPPAFKAELVGSACAAMEAGAAEPSLIAWQGPAADKQGEPLFVSWYNPGVDLA